MYGCAVFVGLIGCTGIDIVREISGGVGVLCLLG